jgi:hypothetical protein
VIWLEKFSVGFKLLGSRRPSEMAGSGMKNRDEKKRAPKTGAFFIS